MKAFIRQFAIIVGLSLVLGLTYNYLSKTPLPITDKYDAHMVDLVISSKINKNKSAAVSTDSPPVLNFQEVDAETLQSLMEAEKAVLLDARTADEYNTLGHIQGAVNLPITQFNTAYGPITNRLAQDKMIICYCEGHDCTDSSLLALELHKKGHKDIFVYKGGMAEWEQLAYPIAYGPGHKEEEN